MDGQELERTALDALAEADNMLRGYLDEQNIAMATARAALAQATALLLLVETVREIAEQSGGDDEDYRAAKAALATKAARERKCRDDD